MYFASPPVLMFLLNAWHIFSEFSLEIVEGSLALCKAIKCQDFVGIRGVFAGSLSLNIVASFGFWPNTNWNYENPWMLANKFFTFKNHAKALSMSSCWSSRILSSIFTIIMLCHSTNPFTEWRFCCSNFYSYVHGFAISKNWL